MQLVIAPRWKLVRRRQLERYDKCGIFSIPTYPISHSGVECRHLMSNSVRELRRGMRGRGDGRLSARGSYIAF